MGDEKSSKPRPFKLIRQELAEVKERLGSDVKVFWKKPPPPWPVRVQTTISQQAPYAYDADDVKVQLYVLGPKMENLPIKAELLKSKLPDILQKKIVETIEEKWKTVLRKQMETSELRSWFLVRMLLWMRTSYEDLMRSVPECVDSYLGTNSSGATMRRYTIVEPRASESSSEAEEEEKELTEEQLERRRMVMERRAEKARIAAHKAACEREAKKQRAMRMREMGIETGRPRQESKKEREARLAARNKQGVRMRKTGARAKKYAGEGSAIAKNMSKKERKRQQREMESS